MKGRGGGERKKVKGEKDISRMETVERRVKVPKIRVVLPYW